MTEAGGFWTPHRKGVVIAVLCLGASLYVVFGLIAVLRLALPLWTLLPAVVIATVASDWMEPYRGSRTAPARCPECSKSVFVLKAGKGLRGRIGLLWPERECSKCGADLTGGRSPWSPRR